MNLNFHEFIDVLFVFVYIFFDDSVFFNGIVFGFSFVALTRKALDIIRGKSGLLTTDFVQVLGRATHSANEQRLPKSWCGRPGWAPGWAPCRARTAWWTRRTGSSSRTARRRSPDRCARVPATCARTRTSGCFLGCCEPCHGFLRSFSEWPVMVS